VPLDDLVEPAGYSALWLVLGILAVLLALAWVVVAWLLTRRRPGDPGRAAPTRTAPGADPYAHAREDRLADLARIEREHAAGVLDDRDADLAVAAVLREFAQTRTGLPARSLTAAELHAAGWTGGTAELLVDLLAPTFSAPGAGEESVRAALRGAREVVSRW
jgi:hypothetical protein